MTAVRAPRPLSWGRVDGSRTDPGYLGRATRAVVAAMGRIRPADAGSTPPVLPVGAWDAPESFTHGPAGWFTFAAAAGTDGFRLGGRLLGAGDLARAIWRCPRWCGRPVLLVTQPWAGADGTGEQLGRLADELGAPVYAADGGVRFTYGRAFTDRVFWCFRPGAASDAPQPVGDVLPRPGPVRGSHASPLRSEPVSGSPATPPGVELPEAPPRPVTAGPEGAGPGVVAGPAAATAGPDATRGADSTAMAPEYRVQPMTVAVFEAPRFDLAVARLCLPPAEAPPATPGTPPTTGAEAESHLPVGPRQPSPAVAPSPPPVSLPIAQPSDAPWFPVTARSDPEDRERMRAVLGWKFETYLRSVARALSLHPGLRGAVGNHDGGTGLIAVLALLDGFDTRVAAGLRDGGIPDDDVQMLARCALAGLAQLPAVSGAVFAGAPDGTDLHRRYPTGAPLVEPAFVPVSQAVAGDARYAIWSSTARRVDQLRPQPGGTAMFPAGTRFAVLGVHDNAGDPCLLLREVVRGRRSAELDERAAHRLREVLALPPGPANAASTAETAGRTRLPWPLGLNGNRRFATDIQHRG